jgi:hypothetical protein
MISTGDKFVSIGDKSLSTVEIFELNVDKSVSNTPSREKTSQLVLKLLQLVLKHAN